MSLENFSKQLQREFKRNPKQAAILGVLGGVAVWFWLPLIWKPSDSVPATTTDIAASVRPAPGPAASLTAPPSSVPGSTTMPATAGDRAKNDWRSVLSRIESDPRMQPVRVTMEEMSRRPFEFHRAAGAATGGAEELAEATDAPVIEPLITPEQAGVKLAGTIVSRGRAMAIVNGETFREGDVITAKAGIEFLLAEVTDRGVVFERQGQQFPLLLRRESPSGGRIKLRSNNER